MAIEAYYNHHLKSWVCCPSDELCGSFAFIEVCLGECWDRDEGELEFYLEKVLKF